MNRLRGIAPHTAPSRHRARSGDGRRTVGLRSEGRPRAAGLGI